MKYKLYLLTLIIISLSMTSRSEDKNVINHYFAEDNKVFFIGRNYDLNSDTVKVGVNSVLFFLGGSISNGTLVFNHNKIQGWPKLVNCKCEGSVSNQLIKMKWFKGHFLGDIRSASTIAQDNTTLLFERNSFYTVSWNDRHYLVDLKTGMTIDGNGATIKIEDRTNSSDFTWGSIFRISKKENVTIKNLCVDFNGDNNPVIQSIGHLYWERNSLTVAEFADGLTINDCKLIGQRGANDITIFSSDNVKVHHCIFINSGQVRPSKYLADHSTLLVLSCKNADINNNRILNDSLRTIGTGYDLGLVDSNVYENYVENAHYGMILSANNACSNVCINNNEFRDNTYALVTWSFGKTSSHPIGSAVENLVIKNNIFQWIARTGQYYCRGINMKVHTEGTTKDVLIEGNSFLSELEDNSINLDNSFEYAIYLGAAPMAVDSDLSKVENVTIKGNNFSTIVGPAIRISDKAYYTTITNNSFKDCCCTIFSGFNGGIIVAAVESQTSLSDVCVENNIFYNDKYQRGKYGVVLNNALSNILVSNNHVNLLTTDQLFIEPGIRKEHNELKDIIIR